MKQKVGYFLMVALLTLVLIGCGNSSDKKEDDTTIPSTDNTQKNEQAEEQMQKLIDYNKAIDILDSLTGKLTLEQFEMMETAYNILKDMGDYKNVPELLQKFDVYNCVLINDSGVSVHDMNGVVICTIDDWPYDEHFALYTYSYNDKGQIIRKDVTITYLKFDGVYNPYYTYEYDSNGNLITEFYSGYGDILSSTSKYTYSDDGKLISKTVEYEDSISTYIYEYNQYGNLMKETNSAIMKETNSPTGQSLSHTYIYDENQILIEKDYESIRGLYIERYTYDSQGRLIENEGAYSDDKTNKSTITYEYKQYHLYDITN